MPTPTNNPGSSATQSGRERLRIGLVRRLHRAHLELKAVPELLDPPEHADGVALGEPRVEQVDVVPAPRVDPPKTAAELRGENKPVAPPKSDDKKVDAAKLQIRDGVISPAEDPKRKVTFADLVKANKGPIRQTGRCIHPGAIGRAMNRGIGACFIEVEVDTWTGDYRLLRAAYCHDAGNVTNPLLADADMRGSLVQSISVATEAVPWDREFPGTRHYAVGYLSYRLPTIMDLPTEQTNVFINSLEPRWFFGSKGFAETAIGAPPGALANAIYNACGVRIREHPITKDKILAGLKALKKA